MAHYFFDSSALVKYSVSETGTPWVHGLMDTPPPNEIAIAHVTGAEIGAAISRRVRMGWTTVTAGANAMSVFTMHFQTKYRVVIVALETVEHAMSLAENYA